MAVDEGPNRPVEPQHIQKPIHADGRNGAPPYDPLQDNRSWPHGALRGLYGASPRTLTPDREAPTG